MSHNHAIRLTNTAVSPKPIRMVGASIANFCFRVAPYWALACLGSCATDQLYFWEIPYEVIPLSLFVEEQNPELTEVLPGMINIEPISVTDIGDRMLSIDLLFSGETAAFGWESGYGTGSFGNLNGRIELDQFMTLRNDEGEPLGYSHYMRSGHFGSPPRMLYGEDCEYLYLLCTVWIKYYGWDKPRQVEVQLLDNDLWYFHYDREQILWDLNVFSDAKLLSVMPEEPYVVGDSWNRADMLWKEE